MKNKKVLKKKNPTEIGIGIVLLVAILIGGTFYLQSKKEIVHDVQEAKQSQLQNQQIAGEEKDDHGCVISSGSFWCEQKQSCVKDWNESCKNVNDLDNAQWSEYNSREHNVNFDFYMKYPNEWFNLTDLAGDSTWGLPLYSKNDYTNTCQKDKGDALHCSQTGLVAIINVVTPPSIPRKIIYSDEQKKSVIVSGYKGLITEGIVNDSNGGFVVKNGEREIFATFSNVRGKNFEIIMKINNNSDREVFAKIISSIKFNI